MAFTRDPQLPTVRATERNPSISDGVDTIEFTYAPDTKSPGISWNENASFHQTQGGQARKQADGWIRSVDISWLEPSNNVPVRINKMLRGSGNRALNALTFVYSREILSQLGDGVEDEFSAGIGKLTGFVRDFKARRIGKDATGTQMYRCRLVFQEANEVTP